jgi:hypothetical protein
MQNNRKFRRDLGRAVDAATEVAAAATQADSDVTGSGPESIRWDRVGSLFWFPSEMRKLRLFFEPEAPTQERVVDGLLQARHHAERLNCNQFVIREIDRALQDVQQNGFRELNLSLRKHHADRLRVAMDTLAVLAESTDPDWNPALVPRILHRLLRRLDHPHRLLTEGVAIRRLDHTI